MAERPRNEDDTASAGAEPGETQGGPTSQGPATPPDVRDVVGRRGYDEGEDETATEDEQH